MEAGEGKETHSPGKVGTEKWADKKSGREFSFPMNVCAWKTGCEQKSPGRIFG